MLQRQALGSSDARLWFKSTARRRLSQSRATSASAGLEILRVHLMNDSANRRMFYGASCKVCSDAKWKVQRKLMDQ
jgi:hypothetical protein